MADPVSGVKGLGRRGPAHFAEIEAAGGNRRGARAEGPDLGQTLHVYGTGSSR